MNNKYTKKLQELVDKIHLYNNDVDEELVHKAFHFSYKAHQNQLRSSGKPFFEHPLAVSMILADYQMDISTICSALLHDVAEDTGVTIREVEELFGEEIALLVDGVTKISGINFDSFETKQAENFRKMIISMVKDIRVILIKFADRLHNMRTLDYLPPRKRKRIAMETMDVYAPLAHRLGITKIETELEDRVFQTLNQKKYSYIEKKLAEELPDRKEYVEKIGEQIKEELRKIDINDVNIYCEQKNFFKIYEKMQYRNLPFEEIPDTYMVKILVEKAEQCYFVLGVVHNLFTPVHDHFKDYIATPKSNMYQSLHTTVVGPSGKMTDIQIRTRKMDLLADNGIAFHWITNKGKINKSEIEEQFAWLRRILEWQQDSKDSGDFMENLKNDLFHDEVFVFTPNGDLHRLPRESTPVDFAFNVHTDIGYHCIGAKSNRRIVPLNYKLRNGDVVEILTSNKAQPNPEWLRFVKTSKAKSKIKRWIKDEMFEQSLKLGKDLLSLELGKLNLSENDFDLAEIAQSYGLDDENQLHVAIGKADLNVKDVLEKIAPAQFSNKTDGREEKDTSKNVKPSKNGIRIQGENNFLISFANCCQPIPGDRILGFISKGRGIEIHRCDCTRISFLLQRPEKRVHVEWDVDKDRQFLVKLKLFADNRPNFLKDISESIASNQTNIISMVLNAEGAFIHNTVVVEVKNLNQLTRVINKIRNIKGVISVERLNSDIKPKSEVY
ncbi:RelA/SpoT family protein [candidate division KSB1 bacterium]|nr:RelA/SpoT family protein [candidate division KSB1 bacterium]